MRRRLVLLPLLVLCVAGLLGLLHPWERPAGSGEAPPPPRTPATPPKGSRDGPWHPQPIRVERLPRTESLPAVVSSPAPIPVFSDLRAPFVEIPVREGQAVRKGDLLARAGTDSIVRALAEAEKRGDGKEAARLKEALSRAELRAPADGIVFRMEVTLGEMPPPPGPGGPRPVAVLHDWRAVTYAARAPRELASSLSVGAGVFVRSGDAPEIPAAVVSLGEPGGDGSVPLEARPLQPPESAPEPGAAGEILLPTGEREGLVVPEAAIRREEGRTVVLEVGITGDLVPRTVGVGRRLRGGFVEITGVPRGISVAVFEAAAGPRRE